MLTAAAYIIMVLMLVGFAAIVVDHHKQAQARRDRAIVLRILRYLEHQQGRRVA